MRKENSYNTAKLELLITYDKECTNYNLDYFNNKTDKFIYQCEFYGNVYSKDYYSSVHFSKKCNYCESKYKEIEILKLMKKNHPNYNLLEYSSNESKILCKIHNEIFKTHISFDKLNRHCFGCSQCYKEKNKYNKNNEKDILNKIKSEWNNQFDVSKYKYITSHIPSTLICRIHNIEFEESYHDLQRHINKCPKCKKIYRGEDKISKYLDFHNIEYIRQYDKFEGLITSKGNQQKCDFYIPSKNLIIEYNGEQHYHNSYITNFNENKLKEQKEKDKFKRKYCLEHNINLLIIPYNMFNQINTLLDKYFNGEKLKYKKIKRR